MAAEHVALIGTRIREARIAKGWTQRELGENLPGKSDGTQVSKWERGRNRVSDDTLAHIARLLERDVSWFMVPAPDKSETPNLTHALNGEQSQLNRIEDQLKLLTEQIETMRLETAARALAVIARLDEALPPAEDSRRQQRA